MKVPEYYRLKNHPVLGSNSSYGNNGFFCIPHHRIANYQYNVQASSGMGWEHTSITLTKNVSKGKIPDWTPVDRCCTWEEMCYVKSLFWNDDDAVMQLHPPKSDFVNNHPYCLHLWRPINETIPLPPAIMVGSKKDNVQTNVTP